MAYLEVWKSGELVTRRRVDEQKARKGCRIRLGSAGETRLAIGQSQKIGKYDVRMFEGDPPTAHSGIAETASIPPDDEHDDQSLPSFSKVSSEPAGGRRHGRPDIEGYRIIEPLGEGGMGIVWCAEQLSTRRQVALKLLVSHRIESPKAQARFQREVELTARLDHPNIARIYDSGLHQGMYYYAMELIEGIPLDRYVKSQSLSRTAILGVMQKVCQAVLYAHLRAVIHRDLKPSNILVSPDGEPHILDFGLAKALLDEDEALTISIEGQVAGTPAYMSPEQAAGHHSQLDTRTDVYSLGVILYELLIEQSPHDLSGSMFDVLHRIADGTIRRPCKVDKSIDGELETLLLKALAQNPEDRYASAGALAKDIGNYLSGEPLDAQAPTILYFLRKKALKYRVQIAAGLAVSLVLLGTALVVYTKIVARQAIIASQDWELKLTSSQLSWQELALKVLGENEQEALAALRIIRDEYVSAQDEISQLNHRLGDRKPPIAVRRIDLSPGPPMASTALVRKPSLPGGAQSWTIETHGHRGRIIRLVYSPDGSQLASAGRDGTIRIWDSRSGQLEHAIVDPNTHVSDLAWSVDGKSLRGTAAADPLRQSVWTIEPDRIQSVGRASGSIEWDDGSAVSWSAGLQAPARMLDDVAGSLGIQLPPTWSAKRRLITALAFLSERQQLACGDEGGTTWVLDAASGQVLHTQPGVWCGPTKSISFSPDGKTLATYSGAGTLCLWQAGRWEPVRRYETERVKKTAVSVTGAIAWAPDGGHIARADSGGTIIEILALPSGEVVRSLSVSDDRITCISWSPKGGLIAGAAESGKLYLWDLQSDSETPSVSVGAHTAAVSALEWMPDGAALITTGRDGKIKVWQFDNGTLADKLERSTSPVACAALSRDGSTLASGSLDGRIRLWNVKDGWTSSLVRSDPNDARGQYSLMTVCWSPDGRLLACGDSAGKVRIYDSTSRQWRRSFSPESGSICSLAWSVNGRGLLCGGSNGKVWIWDAMRDFAHHVVLLPLPDGTGPGLAVGAAGDYRGPPGLVDQIVYSVLTAEAQLTLSPVDFKSRYGWVNEPWQVGLYKPGVETVERIYVDSRSGEPQDGKTWATAFSDLQDGLSIARPNTEIWVAAGVYRPDRETGARTASFHLKNGVRLLGGFVGTETSSDQRDPNNNETILSGDLKGDDRPDFVNNGENSYHVVVAIRTDSNTVLDRFIITGGNADGPGEFHRDEGGGIYNVDGGMTLVRCTFRSNASTRPGAGMHHGSGRSTLFLTACVFRNNRARVKEGHDWGGGISIGGATGKMDNCIFEDNVASSGGAVFLSGTVDFVLKDCTFIGNRATGGSGAVHAWAEDTYSLINCRFVRNSARFHAGAVANEGESKATLVNCVFIGNSSRHGAGGMSHYPGRHGSGSARLTNCTFVGNSTGAEAGGAFYGSGEHGATLSNCVVWSNTDRGDSLKSAQVSGEGVHIDHCCIQGWTGRLGGIGNFGADPTFVDINGPDDIIGTEDDNLSLKPSSPCINAGDNDAIGVDASDLDADGDTNESVPFDFEGNTRILNGTVDIGAYESG